MRLEGMTGCSSCSSPSFIDLFTAMSINNHFQGSNHNVYKKCICFKNTDLSLILDLILHSVLRVSYINL